MRMYFHNATHLLLHERSGKLPSLFSFERVGINPLTRLGIIDWLLINKTMLHISNDMLFLIVCVIDTCITKMNITHKKILIFAYTSIFMILKKNRIGIDTIKEFREVIDINFSVETFMKAEYDIIKLVNFNFEFPNVSRYVECFSSDQKMLEIMRYVCICYYASSATNDVLPSVVATAAYHITCLVTGDIVSCNIFNIDFYTIRSMCNIIASAYCKMQNDKTYNWKLIETIKNVKGRVYLATILTELNSTKCSHDRIEFLPNNYRAGNFLSKKCNSVCERAGSCNTMYYHKHNHVCLHVEPCLHVASCNTQYCYHFVPEYDDEDYVTVSLKLGCGSYSTVSKIKLSPHSKVFALKKVLCETEGIPGSFINEASVLNNLDHPNIIKCVGVIAPNKMILELMTYDLSIFKYNYTQGMSLHLQEKIAKDLLKGLSYMHSRGILNCDIKPQNILVKGDDIESLEIKYCDFGISYNTGSTFDGEIPDVCTLWYRPIEVLLGCCTFTESIDIWSLAYTICEVCAGFYPFRGNNQIEQIHEIFKLLGTPGKDHALSKLPYYSLDFPKWKGNPIFTKMGVSGKIMSIVEEGLILDPTKRLSASDLLLDVFGETYDCCTRNINECVGDKIETCKTSLKYNTKHSYIRNLR